MIITQTVITLLISLVGVVFLGSETAISLLSGGLLCVSGNTAFAFIAFRRSGARSGQEVLASFYTAEVCKLLFLLTVFVLLFKNVPMFQEKQNVAGLFLSFILVQQVFWFGPWIEKGLKKQ